MTGSATPPRCPRAHRPSDRVMVRLRVPAEFGCRSADVTGDFTAWAPVAMIAEPDGGYQIDVVLPRGRTWRYRFWVDGEAWINDPSADDYQPIVNGASVSLRRT